MALSVDLSLLGFLHHLCAILLNRLMHVIAEACVIVVRKCSETVTPE
jgi:hypothetical protein